MRVNKVSLGEGDTEVLFIFVASPGLCDATIQIVGTITSGQAGPVLENVEIDEDVSSSFPVEIYLVYALPVDNRKSI